MSIITVTVLVPFYRGAVVFLIRLLTDTEKVCSRPLLSRSGCISAEINSYKQIAGRSRPLLSRSGCI